MPAIRETRGIYGRRGFSDFLGEFIAKWPAFCWTTVSHGCLVGLSVSATCIVFAGVRSLSVEIDGVSCDDLLV